jgi:hypothetical protein
MIHHPRLLCASLVFRWDVKPGGAGVEWGLGCRMSRWSVVWGMKVRPSLNDMAITSSQASVSGWLALTEVTIARRTLISAEIWPARWHPTASYLPA